MNMDTTDEYNKQRSSEQTRTFDRNRSGNSSEQSNAASTQGFRNAKEANNVIDPSSIDVVAPLLIDGILLEVALENEADTKVTSTTLYIISKDYPASIIDEKLFQALKKEINETYEMDEVQDTLANVPPEAKQGAFIIKCLNVGTVVWIDLFISGTKPLLKCVHSGQQQLLPVFMIWVQSNEESFNMIKQTLSRHKTISFKTGNWIMIKNYNNKKVGSKYLFLGDSTLSELIANATQCKPSNAKVGQNEIQFTYKVDSLPGSIYQLLSFGEQPKRPAGN